MATTQKHEGRWTAIHRPSVSPERNRKEPIKAMSTQNQTALVVKQSEVIPFGDIERMAAAVAKSGLFGIKSPDQAVALMLVAQSEGRHPASVAAEFDIIQGRPALKSQAALARFQTAGGKIRWITRNDEECAAVFSHPAGGTLQVSWTMERAHAAGLTGKQTWKQYPTAMLSARTVAEGVRAVFPACLNGVYLAEEVQDFDSRPATGKFQAVKASLPPVEEKVIPAEVVQVIEAPKVEKEDPIETIYEMAEQDKVTEDQIIGFLRSKDAIASDVEYLSDIKPAILRRLKKSWPQVIEFAVAASMEEVA